MRNKSNLFILLSIFTITLMPILTSSIIAFSPDSFLTLPINDWSYKWFLEFINQKRWTEALLRSLAMALVSTLVSLILGVALAYAMTRLDIPFKKIIHGTILLPLVIPPIILGMGILPMFYFMQLNGTPIQIILVHTCLILPINYLILKSKLNSLDNQMEEVARGLGAGHFESFWLITLPLLFPEIVVSGIIAFATSMNETLITLFMAGPNNETISTITWSQLKNAPTPLIAVASIINLIIVLSGATIIYLIKTRSMIFSRK